MNNQGLRSAAAMAVATGMLVAAAPASGRHIPGATYTGTHSGGGSVEFDVSANGKEISRFKATNLRGDTCTVDQMEVTFNPGNGPSTEGHTFLHQRSVFGSGLAFSGDFNAKQSAKGDLSFRTASGFGAPSCESPDYSWTARTTASPARSEECRFSTREFKYWKRRLKKAKRAFRNAPTAKAGKELRKSKKYYKVSKKDRRLDC